MRSIYFLLIILSFMFAFSCTEKPQQVEHDYDWEKDYKSKTEYPTDKERMDKVQKELEKQIIES